MNFDLGTEVLEDEKWSFSQRHWHWQLQCAWNCLYWCDYRENIL